jgi:2,4-dienoyl-CoA reductase (NADPH2)
MAAGGVAVQDLATGMAARKDCDWVVLALQQAPDDALYFALKSVAGGPPAHRVGDCLAPRRAHAAVIDGDRVGALL